MFALYFEFTFWFVFQKNCRDLWLSIIFSLTSSVSFGSLTALYLIYLLLFNFQGPFCLPLALRFLSSLARLIYYIIFRAVCQGVLQKFLKFFSKFCFTEPDVCFFIFHPLGLAFACPCFLAWRDLYIISYFLEFVKRFCKSFWGFFREPLRFSFLTPPLLYLSLTALILYHIPRDLSSPFVEKNRLCHRCLTSPHFVSGLWLYCTYSKNSREKCLFLRGFLL